MEPPAVKAEGISFGFGRRAPLFHHIDLEIPERACYGLLGKNGAGKSTLMKLLLGLERPRSGRVEWWGVSFSRARPALFSRIGLLIEAPRLYPHLSGFDNLRVYATYRQLPLSRIGEVLERVGLARAAPKKAGAYSTGMQQRLGIALALLHQPELLILDEPTNGLDPQGIAEVRELILELRQEHTILLSSHLLSEVEQTCTHLAVLDEGKMLFQGPLAQLRAQKTATLEVEIDLGPDRAWPEATGIEAIAAENGSYRIALREKEDIPELIDRLRSLGVPVYQVRIREQNLETSFLQLFKNRNP